LFSPVLLCGCLLDYLSSLAPSGVRRIVESTEICGAAIRRSAPPATNRRPSAHGSDAIVRNSLNSPMT
jgi:hypothetical protein